MVMKNKFQSKIRIPTAKSGGAHTSNKYSRKSKHSVDYTDTEDD